MVVRDDRLAYERYFSGVDRATRQTSFSVAKSILSTLVGIAIDEGLIGSLDESVTDYVPDLLESGPRFERVTLSDLLAMSSGIRYEEPDVPVPWGDDVTTYHGVDLRQAALDDTVIEGPLGRVWHNNNYNPLLLGLVLERATRMSVSDYLATRLWAAPGRRIGCDVEPGLRAVGVREAGRPRGDRPEGSRSGDRERGVAGDLPRRGRRLAASR